MTIRTITFFALGTMNSIKIFNKKEEKFVWKAIKRVHEIDKRMSVFRPDSDLSLISGKAGKSFQKIHKDTMCLIQKAVEFSILTHGAFDITINPLVQLWGINKKADFVPSEAEIQKALAFVDYHFVTMDRRTLSCKLEKKGQSMDLGGVAKGYAADEVRRILLESGVRSAMINLGGNVSVIGDRPDGNPWKIGIQNPLASRGESAAILSVTNKAVVTSGCNERFFMKNGIRYHHIINPKTGRPVQNFILSVTTVCSSSTDADILATAFLILGPEKSFPIIQKFDVNVVFIMNDLSVAFTPGLKKNITFNAGVKLYEPA